MNTMIYLTIGVFTVYIAAALANFGIPKSLSMTYYLYKEKYNIGFIFPLMMYFVVGCLMPFWLEMSTGSVFQFLAFLAPAGLLFVATAPAFKSSSLENMVHQVSAYFAAACAIAWIILVTPYWITVPISLIAIMIIAIITKTVKSGLIFWLEMIAFLATFITILLFI